LGEAKPGETCAAIFVAIAENDTQVQLAVLNCQKGVLR
jgi:hypothetical protein